MMTLEDAAGATQPTATPYLASPERPSDGAAASSARGHDCARAVTYLAEQRGTWSPRQWFRGYLRQHTSGTADLTWYFIQSVPRFGTDPEVQLAVEELVDQLGRILGFEAKRDDDDAGSAVWMSPAGWHLLVWIVDAAERRGAPWQDRARA